MPVDGDGRWKGVGEVRDAGRLEVGQGLNSSVSLGGFMGINSTVRMSSAVLESSLR